MRVSVDLDSDVAALIEQVMAERHLTFEQAVNDVLRCGLGSRRRTSSYRAAHLVEASIDLDEALSVAAALEDHALVERLELRR